MIYNEGGLSFVPPPEYIIIYIHEEKKKKKKTNFKLSQMITYSVFQYLWFHLETDVIVSFRKWCYSIYSIPWLR